MTSVPEKFGRAPRSGGRAAARQRDVAGLVDQARTVGTAALRVQRRPAVEPDVRTAPLKVAPPRPVATPRAPFVLLVLLLVVGGVLGILVLNTKIAENSFRIRDLRTKQGSLDQQEQQLQQDLTEKEAPGNLAAEARRLGLVPAPELAFIELPDGRVLGVPQPAGGPVSATDTTAGQGGADQTGAAQRQGR